MHSMGVATIVFIVFLLLGMPVAFAIGISGLVFFMVTEGLPYTIVVQKVLATTQSFTMLAIPLFIFAGNLMNNTGITKRLMKLADVLTGHMHGNIAQISCVLSTLMGGVSGSANADAAMESRILGPEMTKRGYSRGWSAAINGLSSLIVATIPPSMGLIIFGSIGEVSIGRLFAAGLIPGLIMMVALMIAVDISARKRKYLPDHKKPASLKEVGKALIDGIWALLFPILLIVFIRFGIMTPSESGAFAAVYAIFVGTVIYKELTWKVFFQTLKDSTKDIAVVTLILAMSGVFGYGIVYDRVPQVIASTLMNITSNPTLMLLIIIALLTVSGMFVETTVIALLLTPILLPVVTSLGIDPVHFGIVMMTVTTMGIMTPPVGIALYTTSTIMECTPEETAKESVPFFIAIFTTVAIVTLIPQVSLFVPNLIFGPAF
ncbi:TRAP dicarboxylate transporter, DctM subunit [Sphaerochaeta globosa str. Buddy]|uniref:TRAP dicarboxylate transporter, DctM subunit n=2 Tax=Sphaerochaeta TaxID=399320 RepID=F0RUG0_SPHGB|nr:TRAP dicarboxylate transporter, DctM subunit [Sphaerochaeta globosa str. Buddy]